MKGRTEAQRQLLRDVDNECGAYCVGNYRPARKLVSLGLAEWEDGNPSSDWLYITEAGRTALRALEKQP
jgi:hypothetical protein